MNIYIDLTTLHNVYGKRVYYYPQVGWTIDDKDTITPERMESIKNKLQSILEQELNPQDEQADAK